MTSLQQLILEDAICKQANAMRPVTQPMSYRGITYYPAQDHSMSNSILGGGVGAALGAGAGRLTGEKLLPRLAENAGASVTKLLSHAPTGIGALAGLAGGAGLAHHFSQVPRMDQKSVAALLYAMDRNRHAAGQ
jgi:hypothetical protein